MVGSFAVSTSFPADYRRPVLDPRERMIVRGDRTVVTRELTEDEKALPIRAIWPLARLKLCCERAGSRDTKQSLVTRRSPETEIRHPVIRSRVEVPARVTMRALNLRLAAQLEQVASGKLSASTLIDEISASYPTLDWDRAPLKEILEALHHFSADEDIRATDSGYAQFQIDDLRRRTKMLFATFD